MIQAVFVIRDGLCLFSRQYEEDKLDSDLISGFLGAINLFTESMTNGSALEMITMKRSTFSFTIIDNLLLDHNRDKISPL